METKMSAQIPVERFKKALLACLEETFSNVRGIYLDKGTTLYETLDGVSSRPSLSPRESEVLALLAEGAPNKVIARRLNISVHTAKFHVAAILIKLGAANRTDAIAIAMRQGLVLV